MDKRPSNDSMPIRGARKRRPLAIAEADEALRELAALGVLSPQEQAAARKRAQAMVSGTAAVSWRRNDDARRQGAGSETIYDPKAQQREAAMVISAMEAAVEAKLPRLSPMERQARRISRATLRVRAELRLWADGATADPWILYTRDLDARAMGFVCQDRLPLGYGGTLSFVMPGGRPERLDVTVTRCRQCSSGWCEGALHFSRPQAWLVDELREIQQMSGNLK